MGLVDVILNWLSVLATLCLVTLHVTHSPHEVHVRFLDKAVQAWALGKIPDAGKENPVREFSAVMVKTVVHLLFRVVCRIYEETGEKVAQYLVLALPEKALLIHPALQNLGSKSSVQTACMTLWRQKHFMCSDAGSPCSS